MEVKRLGVVRMWGWGEWSGYGGWDGIVMVGRGSGGPEGGIKEAEKDPRIWHEEWRTFSSDFREPKAQGIGTQHV